MCEELAATKLSTLTHFGGSLAEGLTVRQRASIGEHSGLDNDINFTRSSSSVLVLVSWFRERVTRNKLRLNKLRRLLLY
jgi:hypothetical protein